MSRKLTVIGIAVVALGILAFNSLFVVHETDQALVLQFGEPQRSIQEPGLHAKLPFIQQVTRYDKRVLDLDPPVEQVILADQKRLDVDAFARFRITDPLLFYQAVSTETIAQQRLQNLTNAALRRVLGNVTLLTILSEERSDIMRLIQTDVNEGARGLGVDIVDLRIRRADLPEETSQAIFARMRSEREREAAEFRAQGEEQAQQIRSRAERERTVILAEAQREANITRGVGDRDAIEIYADAYNRDAEFFAFYRTMEAYRNSLSDYDTTLVLSPDSDFFQFFGNMNGRLPVDGQVDPETARAPGAAPPLVDGMADGNPVRQPELDALGELQLGPTEDGQSSLLEEQSLTSSGLN